MTTALWGLFLACSWTWCIGMYLPRLMVGQFGWPGWVAFAVPNVLGCAAFGYVIATRERGVTMVERHGGAMVAFSLVAIGYQLFFLTYVVDAIAGGTPWIAPAAAVGACAAGALLASLGDRAWLALAAVVYAISLVTCATADAVAEGIEPRDGASLLFVAPAVAIGFLLCPYLDLTFHRALRRAPSRHAFAVFAVAFVPMIALTPFIWPRGWPADGPLPAPVLAHVAAQLVFTIGAHAREVRAAQGVADPARRAALLALPLLGAAVLPVARLLSAGANPGDDAYLRILGLYGLVFPAYAVMFIGPWRPMPVNRRTLMIFAAVIVALAPALEVGFIQRRFEWLAAVPAALVVWAITRTVFTLSSRSTA